jgi:hypothetical protein
LQVVDQQSSIYNQLTTGVVAKRQGKGLQNPHHGFKSRRRLKKKRIRQGSFSFITGSPPDGALQIPSTPQKETNPSGFVFVHHGFPVGRGIANPVDASNINESVRVRFRLVLRESKQKTKTRYAKPGRMPYNIVLV